MCVPGKVVTDSLQDQTSWQGTRGHIRERRNTSALCVEGSLFEVITCPSMQNDTCRERRFLFGNKKWKS